MHRWSAFVFVVVLVGCERKAEPQQDIISLVDGAVIRSQSLADTFQFSEAFAALKEVDDQVEKNANVLTYELAKPRLESAHASVRRAETEYRNRLAQGWKLADGKLLSPPEQERLRREEAERLEQEKQAEARRVEEARRAEAERAREQEEARKAEEENKFWEVAVLSPKRIFSYFKSNEIRAEADFKNRWCVILGTIDSIGYDLLRTPYITLDAGDTLFQVQCMFSKSDAPVLHDLHKGDTVAVYARYMGKMGNVLFDQCRLVTEVDCWGKTTIRLRKP